MDALRQVALAEGARPAEPYAAKFHKTFLFIVHKMGRMHEASLLAGFKLWTLDLLSDMDSAPTMLLKGKVPILPHWLKGRNEVRQIFTATQKHHPAETQEN